MQLINDILTSVENNIELLLRKLTELEEKNNKLTAENIKLKQRLEHAAAHKKTESSDKTEDVGALREDLDACVAELEACIKMIEKESIYS